MALRDLLNNIEQGIGNAASGVGNFVQHDIVQPAQQALAPAPVQQNQQAAPPPINNFMNWLGSRAQAVKNTVGNTASTLGSNVQNIAQQANRPNVMQINLDEIGKTIPPPIKDFASYVGRQPMLNLKTGIPSIDNQVKFSPTIGQYVSGNVVKPFEQGMESVLAGKSNPVERALGAGQTAAGVFGLSPTGVLYNTASGTIGGALRSARTGKPLDKSIQEGIGSPTDIANSGLGIKNPVVAGAIDMALTRNPSSIAKNAKSVGSVLKAVTQYNKAIPAAEAEDAMKAVARYNFNKSDINYSMSKQAQEDENTIRNYATSYIDNKFGNKAPLDQVAQELTNRVRVDQKKPQISLGIVSGKNAQQPISSEAGIVKGKVRTTDMPTQTEIKNRAEIAAGNPDLYTQRAIKIKKVFGDEVQPKLTPIEQQEMAQGEKLFGNSKPEDFGVKQEKAQTSMDQALQDSKFKNDVESGMTTTKKTPLPPEKPSITTGNVRTAREAMDTVMTQIAQRRRALAGVVKQGVSDSMHSNPVAKTIGVFGHKMSEDDMFRDAIEHPEDMSAYLKVVDKPQEFEAAVNAHKEFTQFAYDKLNALGDLGYRNNYYSHVISQEPGNLEAISQFVKSKNFRGYYHNERKFDDIRQAFPYLENHGTGAVLKDLKHYSEKVQKEAGATALSKSLRESFPSDVFISKGEAAPIDMVQSRIPGAKGLFVRGHIQKQLADLEQLDKGKLTNAILAGQKGIKAIKLAGGLFHIKNTGLDYIANHVVNAKAPRLIQATKVFFSDAADARYRQQMIKEGVVDDAAKMHVTLSTKQDFPDVNVSNKAIKIVGKYTGLNFLHHATFERTMDFFKLETVRILKQKGKIDFSTPEGKQAASAYGRLINNEFGGQNRIVGDDVFRNKFSQVASQNIALAPDYQQGRFKRTFSALNPNVTGKTMFKIAPRTGANNMAFTTLATRIVMTAVLVEALRHVIGRPDQQSQNIADIITNDFLDPNYPTPWQNNGKDQIAHVPATNISDLVKMVSNPEHFFISHLAGGSSEALQFLSNQDYFGNPLSQTNNPAEKGMNLAGGTLPIPAVQIGKVAQGKMNPGNAVLNFLGDRVSTDPNDPTMRYFKQRDAVLKSLPQDAQDAYTGLQAAKHIDPNDPNKRLLEGELYSAFPQLYQVDKAAALAGVNGDQSKVDPIYADKYQALAPLYYRYETLPPKDAFAKQLMQDHPEISQLMADRSAYFQANPIQAKAGAPVFDAGPQADPYIQAQLAAKNYSDPRVQAYLNGRNDYNNQKLQQLNLSPVNQYGNLPFQQAKSNASSASQRSRSAARQAKRTIRKYGMRNNFKIAKSSKHKFKIASSKTVSTKNLKIV